jgi:hypothetical protein
MFEPPGVYRATLTEAGDVARWKSRLTAIPTWRLQRCPENSQHAQGVFDTGLLTCHELMAHQVFSFEPHIWDQLPSLLRLDLGFL